MKNECLEEPGTCIVSIFLARKNFGIKLLLSTKKVWNSRRAIVSIGMPASDLRVGRWEDIIPVASIDGIPTFGWFLLR